MSRAERRLVAVLAADAAGYSRLMEADEEETHARMMRLWAEVMQPCIAALHGQVIKHTGDGFLATFGSASDAAQCALRMQREVQEREMGELPDRRIGFRMGLNVADALIEAHDIFGDGVNIAARLQTYAEPGGLVVSGAIAEQIGGRPGITAVDLGDFFLKNLTRPVRAYSLRQTTGPAAPIQVPGPALPDDRPSIAVLPFRMQRTDPEQSYFAHGIIEGIVQVLSGLEGLFVVSLSSTLGYGNRTADVRAVGRELGVRYVLSGSVLQAGNRLRIGTELADSETGAVIHADRYDGDMEDLFQVQDRISTQVVGKIAPQVRQREFLRAMRKHPDNLTAYDLVLQGLDQFHRLDRESFARARGLLQQAIAHDPAYAPAHAYAAWWHAMRIAQGWSADIGADHAAAAHAALAATERNRNDALALAIQGYVAGYAQKDYGAAAQILDHALAVGPNCALAWAFSAANCCFLGEGSTAVQRAERGLRLSPFDPFAFFFEHILSQAHYTNSDFEAAVSWGRRAVAQNPHHQPATRTLIASLVAIGRQEEARATAQRLLQIDPAFSLKAFVARTPLRGETRDVFAERLRQAGLPD
ncbi:MAG TPA: adenylate/guanylate cyclase domain-containing protein [Roseomonas sp.]